jgi:sulfur carrier protein
MKLIINGDHKEFEDDKSLGDIIKELQIEDKVMASAVNMQIVKKDDWKTFIPQDGDRVELLQFVGGG